MRSSDVVARHRAAGREFEATGVQSFVREQGDGEAVLCMHGVPASSFLYRKVIAELAREDGGRAFLKVMRGFERTAAKQRLYTTVLGDAPYPVQVVWGANDPTLKLATYGERAKRVTGVAAIHPVPGKHFPQEDQAPAIAERIAALSRRETS